MPKHTKNKTQHKDSNKDSTTKNVADISNMIEAGQLDTAKTALENFLIQPLSRKEHGAVYADLLVSYMDIINGAHKEYIESLKSAIAHVKEIQAKKKKMNEAIDLAEVRTELSS